MFKSYPKLSEVTILSDISFQGATIARDVVLMRPGQERNTLYIVHIILKDACGKIHVVAKDITNHSYYDEYYQSYIVQSGFENNKSCWRCIRLEEFSFFSF